MAFIRERTEERTGYQNGEHLHASIDNQCDFVMVYRLNETTAERVKEYRDAGYAVHLMTGISWGAYRDYLYGEYDGINHWDEAQTDRSGNIIAHGKDVPYMVPTVSFANYLAEKLKIAVDAGVAAIHVEEPEFWDRAGYSEAFKREYKMFYKEDWQPPHSSLDARYRCARLKAYLYTRTVDRLSASLKEYAFKKYGRELRFYVPTHSLINYTQWKIVSPEGKLADLPYVDGCIAQVWTGTSREANWFNGIKKERTFETAYLEYGVMQELVKGTGRTMWFLHDPIEDNPAFDWNDYRTNYLCTVAASLLHPGVNKYEICPWPTRVFEGSYPKGAPDAERIPSEYRTILNNTFQTLGTIENTAANKDCIGILTGDCELYQRDYPDSEYGCEQTVATGTVLVDGKETEDAFKNKLFKDPDGECELMLRFQASNAFPAFYGLALPLLKYGVNVRPVLLDNARRYAGYLDDYKVLVMSYEYMKPDTPDINTALAEWVRRGGILIYAGDGSDPYNRINSWWKGKYENPAGHLFEMLGIAPTDENRIFTCGKGLAAVLPVNPAKFCFSKAGADMLRGFVADVLSRKGIKTEYKNNLCIRRKNYVIAAVMDESVSSEPLVIEGNFADMFTPDFALKTKVTLAENDKCLLFDLDKIKDSSLEVIGTSVRVLSLDVCGDKITLDFAGAGDLRASLRLKVPFEIKSARIGETPCDVTFDAGTSTVLVSFDNTPGKKTLVLQ